MEDLKLGGKKISKEEEIKILKLKNGSRSYSGDIPFEYSIRGAFSSDIWEPTNQYNIDLHLIRDRINTYFVNLFDWELNNFSTEQMKHTFLKRLEHYLFRYGKVAIVKYIDDFIPIQFVNTKNEKGEEFLDYWDEPTKITAVSNFKLLNNKIFDEGEFVIIYNNTNKLPTLSLFTNRLIQTARALIEVDNSSLLNRTKWAVNIDKDDNLIYDLENAFRSNKIFLPVQNNEFKNGDFQDLTGNDLTATKIDTFSFQLSFMLKLLGLKVNDGNIKKERMSEIEVSRNDEFDNLLIEDMFRMRKNKEKELKDFGISLTIKENELITGEIKSKDDLNGEVNKKGGNNER